MSLKVNILLVEDDLNLGIILSDQLKSDGYAVSLCNNGVEAMQRFNEDKFHLCIFDVMLPRKDGFTLTRDIRKTNTAIPILFLSARGMTEDKVEGFNAGGDDYLSKPFSIEELQLRIKALLKRVNIKVDEKEQTNYALGIFVFDTENQTLVLKDQVKTLTKKEVQILKLLFKYKNQVVSREVILNAVWGQNDYFVGRSLDVFITKLRKYLREDPKILISNIHGVGFKFEILA
jgi:DNA-binding response OmpR family regulator